MPLPMEDDPTYQMPPLTTPPSVNWFVAVMVSDRSASRYGLLTIRLPVVMETSPPA